MNTQTRSRLSWGAAILAIGAALLLPAKASQAQVRVTVVANGAPSSVKVGDPIKFPFTVITEGKPNNNNECEISNLRYAWTVTIAGYGIDQNGNRVANDSNEYPGSGANGVVDHAANNICQSYTITGKCTVSYDASPECGGGGSAEGSQTVDVEVTGTPCNE